MLYRVVHKSMKHMNVFLHLIYFISIQNGRLTR
jgi:hypothetical protein